MNTEQYKAIINGLIAFCQRQELLSTNESDLADELQDLASNEIYIPKQDIMTLIH